MAPQVKLSTSYGGSVGLKAISAGGKASKETMNYDKERNSKNIVKTYAEAMCDIRARVWDRVGTGLTLVTSP